MQEMHELRGQRHHSVGSMDAVVFPLTCCWEAPLPCTDDLSDACSVYLLLAGPRSLYRFKLMKDSSCNVVKSSGSVQSEIEIAPHASEQVA